MNNIMQSKVIKLGTIELPLVEIEDSMIPFDLKTLKGLPTKYKNIAKTMLSNMGITGIGHFTIHGAKFKKNQTHRRGSPHTDGSYDTAVMDWNGGGGNGWKIGENGPPTDSEDHERLYNSPNGGIILVSNFQSCKGWKGEYKGSPNVGGDCSHIDLSKGEFDLEPDVIYYGNNHFIHESLPLSEDTHRVLARITLPEDHVYGGCNG